MQPTSGAGGGWGQQQASKGSQKGPKSYDWEYNFALGYQGEDSKGQQQGWGQQMQQGGDGWSSQPETNIKKPNIGDILGAIVAFPGQLIMMIRESGLWILFLPLLVMIPLFIFAYSAGKFFGGMDEGWGWDKRELQQGAWDRLKGFLQDPKVQRAAKGFMDEMTATLIMDSVEEKKEETKSR
jgi:hypothetical protein